MTAATSFSGIQACVFDAYGTLFDVHSAVARHRQRLGDSADALSALWRNKQLEYSWLRSLMGRHADFWQVTREALKYACDTFAIEDDALIDDLLNAYLRLACYPEVPDTLRRLRQQGMKLAILSNGSPEMLKAALDSAGLTDLLDACLSVEDVGIYKPAPQVYQLAVDRLQVPAGAISFQSSNSWDAAGAASFGFRVAWINRFGQRRDRLPAGPHAELTDLQGFPALLGL
ncbi:MAG: haloacid dehalogenase type II [Gammaproteobacteria bacterium]|nr:haloacid dehalogenase type II [Gammaproteobacteria bacterium]MCP5460063.1 haloacid dehalogenase type II [Gammaproteobacteria bacterium]